MKLKITLSIILFSVFAYSQVTNKGIPLSWKANTYPLPEKIIMPQINAAALLEEDNRNEGKKGIPMRFAYEFTTHYTLNNSGKWATLADGSRIWRGHFIAPGAKAMHFWFNDFYIPEGATLYVYNNDHSELIGAYDERQNNNGPYFGTWPVTGSDVWLEYHEPKEQAGNGKFTICKIGHAYRALRGMGRTAEEAFSESCNYDVECFMPGIENRKNITKHSVTRILGSKPDGSAFVASGALINTTANDGTPYILSANHAWVEGTMYTFRFNWINPQPACPSYGNGDAGINELQTISGATLKARRAKSDFMLMELNAPIPQEWGVIWSGWDRTENVPAHTYGVHHPAGDIMKVCSDDNAPVASNEGNDYYVWNVSSWETGTTEGGSSGSPLLNPQGQIIGQLWYGWSACNGSDPNGLNDAYGRFNISWDKGSTAATRLRDWLDPLNTGAENIGPYPAQPIYANDAKIAFTDLGTDGCSGGLLSPQVRLINYGTSTLTSAIINYSLNNGESQAINWTGSLDENYAVLIDIPQFTGVPGNNTLTIWASAPNGIEDDNPDNNTVSETFMVHNITYANHVTLTIATDASAQEISWDIKDQYGSIVSNAEAGSYDNNLTYIQTFDLDEGCYNFTIYDSANDGICCAFGEGSYILTTETGEIIAQGGQYGHSETTGFKIEHPLGNQEYEKEQVYIYPNPSTGSFTLNGITAGDTFEVHNILGQQVKSGSFVVSGAGTVTIPGSADGVYILSLKSGNTSGSYKLIKQQ